MESSPPCHFGLLNPDGQAEEPDWQDGQGVGEQHLSGFRRFLASRFRSLAHSFLNPSSQPSPFIPSWYYLAVDGWKDSKVIEPNEAHLLAGYLKISAVLGSWPELLSLSSSFCSHTITCLTKFTDYGVRNQTLLLEATAQPRLDTVW